MDVMVVTIKANRYGRRMKDEHFLRTENIANTCAEMQALYHHLMADTANYMKLRVMSDYCGTVRKCALICCFKFIF